MLDFDPSICTDYHAATRREWLVTNGIGGYASGTIAGLFTRTYHGLLIAALEPPLGRTLLTASLDEELQHKGRTFPLYTHRLSSGEIAPKGFLHLQRFRLDGSVPVWTYTLGGALLEKRVWMEPGENTTYVQYQIVHQPEGEDEPFRLVLHPLVNYRNHHATTRIEDKPGLGVEAVPSGFKIAHWEGNPALFICVPGAEARVNPQWRNGFFLSVEAYRGLPEGDAHLSAGAISIQLIPGNACFVAVSCAPALQKWNGLGEAPLRTGLEAYADRIEHDRRVLSFAGFRSSDEPISRLALAADQFIVHRPSSTDPDGVSVIAGYHWFGDWGRDTMISLPGLTLTTGMQDAARSILRTYASFVSEGMLPNRFPDEGDAPEYNTVDATLWYFEALRAYHDATGDDALLIELFPILEQIFEFHDRGTRYNIHRDPEDGLLYAGEEDVQLTWMDAKVDSWVVTPRIGKPVEVNALWYNVLRCLEGFAERLGLSSERYGRAAQEAKDGFRRYWNPQRGFLYDVLDGPDGDDPSLRPNQLFAVSLHYSPLPLEQQIAVVDSCQKHLLTPFGLRSLAPNESGYVGVYRGDRVRRDAAYHQGTVWAWLIGPFVEAHLSVYGDPAAAREFLKPLIGQLEDHGLGSISEIFDGDPPHEPRGCIAQAWSVAEVLRMGSFCFPVVVRQRGAS